MRAERYLVTAELNGIKRNLPWNPDEPLSLDPENKWTLENSDSGLQLRSPESSMQSSNKLPESSPVEIGNEQIRVQIRKLQPIAPAYRGASMPADLQSENKVNQILVFSGVGNLLRSSQPVRNVFIAYSKNHPIFTAHFDENECRLKPLLDGVKLKLQGKDPVSGIVDSSWTIPREQLGTTTVLRGSRWWRFGTVLTAQALPEFGTASVEELETFSLRKILTRLLVAVAVLALLIWITPSQQKTEEKTIEEAPVVKVVIPRAKRPDRPKEPAAAGPAMGQSVPGGTEKPSFTPSGSAKGQPPVQTTVSPPATPPKTTAPAKPTPPQAQAPAKAQTAPAAPAPAARATSPQTAAPHVITPGGKLPAQAKPSAAEASAKAREASLGALRDAFSGALPLAEKSVDAPTGNMPASKQVFAAGDKDLLVPTQIKPGLQGGIGSGVGKIGGLGSENGTGSATGMGGSDRSKGLGGGGTAFQGAGTDTPIVDEGLTKEEVGEVIHKHMQEIRACHESAMLYKPRIQGKVLIQFVISPAGTVIKAGVQESDLPDPYLQNCILRKLPTWIFPKPRNGVKVTVAYPFLFKTLGRE